MCNWFFTHLYHSSPWEKEGLHLLFFSFTVKLPPTHISRKSNFTFWRSKIRARLLEIYSGHGLAWFQTSHEERTRQSEQCASRPWVFFFVLFLICLGLVMFQVTVICSSTVVKTGPLFRYVQLEQLPDLTWCCVETGPPPWLWYLMLSWVHIPDCPLSHGEIHCFPFLCQSTEEFLVILKEFGDINLFSPNRILDSLLLSPPLLQGSGEVCLYQEGYFCYVPKVFIYFAPGKKVFVFFWEFLGRSRFLFQYDSLCPP